ncbi:MAG: hypothetical protein RBR24_04330 [Candidatus Carbobacillus sp.]|nr:hypothetical protein [Candidatus Carbobacillus sp.]
MTKMIRAVYQDIKLRAKLVIILLAFAPFAMVIVVLPITSISLVMWSNLFDLIRTFRYEFFFIPLFIFLVGALYHFNDWIRMRRYDHREDIANHLLALVMVMSGLLSSTVFLAAGIISLVIKHLIYPYFPAYHALFHYKPAQITEGTSVVCFLILFYLITSFIGMLYFLLRAWTNHHVLAAFLTISPFIVEEIVYSIISKLFDIGAANYPIHATTLLLVLIFLLFVILRLTFKQKDFFN